MIVLTIEICETVPGFAQLSASAPPVKATPHEIQIAEAIKVAITEVMTKRKALKLEGGRN